MSLLQFIRLKINEFAQQGRSKELLKIYSSWIRRGDMVLDVGCGDGIITEMLGRELKVKIIGCDIKHYLLRNIKFIKMKDENKLPFPNKSFDTIIFSDVLHHTSKMNQEYLLSEAIRVGKKNILLNEMKPVLRNYIGDLVINKISHPSMDVPLTFRSKDEWLSLLKKFQTRIFFEDIKNSHFSFFSHLVFVLNKK